MTVWWHSAGTADVPAGDDWLAERELTVMAGLVVPKRRSDWRLGRWTAKSLLAAILRVPAQRVEVLAAGDGAPEAFVDGAPAGVSLSLSHRDHVAVAAAAWLPRRVGIDIERVEPRSDAFVREWLSDAERAALPGAGGARDVQVLCCWTGKEASAKVLREGLRLDVRRATVRADPDATAWGRMEVTWETEAIHHRGWWCRYGGSLLALVSDPPAEQIRTVTGSY